MQCPRCGSSNTGLHSPSYFAHQGAGYTCMECERGGADRGRFVVSGEDPAARADSAAARGASAANRAAIVEDRGPPIGVALTDSVEVLTRKPDGTPGESLGHFVAIQIGSGASPASRLAADLARAGAPTVSSGGWEWDQPKPGSWYLRALIANNVTYLGQVHVNEAGAWWEMTTLDDEEGRADTEAEAKAIVVARARALVAALVLAVTEEPEGTR